MDTSALLSRKTSETTLQHYQRLLELNSDGDANLSWTDIYALLFPEAKPVSVEHARKVAKSYELAIEKDNAIFAEGEDSGTNTNGTDAQLPAIAVPRHKDEIEHHKDGSLTSTKLVEMQDEDTKDSAYILMVHGFDTVDWELVSAKNSIWQAHCKGGLTKTLYSSKITVRPKKNGLNFEEISKHFENFGKSFVPKAIEPRQYEYNAELLIPALFDCHVGKLAVIDETANEYNLEIARKRIIGSVQEYINRLQGRKFEKIIFVIGNDYFNCEPNYSTVAGTPQSNACSYTTMFQTGVEILIEAITMFASVSKTEVIFIPGNHSSNSEWVASLILEAFFKDSGVITVDCTPKTRKYRVFGNNLIGFTHGDSEKDRIFSLPSVECPEGWAASVNGSRDMLTGHIHHEKTIEKNGVTVRHVPSLCSSDLWHSKSGFVTSKKRSMAFIYDKTDGLRETLYVNI